MFRVLRIGATGAKNVGPTKGRRQDGARQNLEGICPDFYVVIERRYPLHVRFSQQMGHADVERVRYAVIDRIGDAKRFCRLVAFLRFDCDKQALNRRQRR